MTRSQRIAQLLEVAEARDRNVSRSLSEHRGALEAAQEQLRELLGYRDEYARQFERTGGGGLPGAQLQDYRLFLDRLNRAIAAQNKRIEAQQREYESWRQRWLESHREVASLDKAVERLRDLERQTSEREEQRRNDELAQRRRGWNGEPRE